MTPKQARALGVSLGLLVLVMAVLYLITTFQSGNTKWYFLVMICGILILLMPTFRRRR